MLLPQRYACFSTRAHTRIYIYIHIHINMYVYIYIMHITFYYVYISTYMRYCLKMLGYVLPTVTEAAKAMAMGNMDL